MRLHVNQLLPLAALTLVSGCAFGGGGGAESLPPPPANGPAADYPVVIGDPFTIDGVTYRPDDSMNYDAVGYASVAADGVTKVSGAHKTLPLPSYAEVTSLVSGKTILVRMETRGPMVNDRLVELSAGAAAQLGVNALSPHPVRVRRVNPPEQERAILRSGGQAPERMETPQPLLKVLKRKLDEAEPLAPAPLPAPAAANPAAQEAPAPKPEMIEAIDPDTVLADPDPAPEPEPAPEPAPEPQAAKTPEPEAPKAAAEPVKGGHVVQVAAFSTKERADSVAGPLGGVVSKPGQYWLVRLGPYASKAEAQAGLEKARAAGYSDARIQRAD